MIKLLRVRNGKIQRHIADEVSAVMREIWLNHHRHISSYDLRRIVGQFQQIFRGMDQQDSHEFLTILMDWLHSDLQRDDLTVSTFSFLFSLSRRYPITIFFFCL